MNHKKFLQKLTFLIIISYFLINIKLSYKNKSIKNIKISENFTKTNNFKTYVVKLITTKENKVSLKSNENLCSLNPPKLIGNFTIKTKVPSFFKPFNHVYALENKSQNESVNFINEIKLGGKWDPTNCKSRNKIAIIIPYRDREENLKIFLYNMHPFLQRQELSYRIFLVEQWNDGLFNKGRLMNAAFIEIINKTSSDYDCIIFHDVDLLPTSDQNLYNCPKTKPKHLSILVGKLDYRIGYPILVGGVLIFRIENFIQVNGYSNRFWGWGAEDDDMYYRLMHTGVGFERPAKNTIYEMLQHDKTKKNEKRVELLQEGIGKHNSDGLNNVKYTLIGKVNYPLFSHILIDVGKESV